MSLWICRDCGALQAFSQPMRCQSCQSGRIEFATLGQIRPNELEAVQSAHGSTTATEPLILDHGNVRAVMDRLRMCYINGTLSGDEIVEVRLLKSASHGSAPEATAEGRYERLYHELLYAVGNRHAGESRHQTALRYIRQAEQPSGEACSALPSPHQIAPEAMADGKKNG